MHMIVVLQANASVVTGLSLLTYQVQGDQGLPVFVHDLWHLQDLGH